MKLSPERYIALCKHQKILTDLDQSLKRHGPEEVQIVALGFSWKDVYEFMKDESD